MDIDYEPRVSMLSLGIDGTMLELQSVALANLAWIVLFQRMVLEQI